MPAWRSFACWDCDKGIKMRKGVLLRPLHSVMDDSYSAGELYAVFKDQAFRKSKMMDIVLLSETLRAMDDRPDEEVAPHKEQIWQQVSNRIEEMRKPVALGLTRRAIAVLAIILVLLLTGVAVGMIDWSSVFRNTYHEEQQITRIEDWSLTRKRDILDALKASGYDLSSLPALDGKTDEEQDSILTKWLGRQTDGEVNDWLYNVMEHMKGLFDSWSLEDKAWFSQLLLENGSVHNGDFVNVRPPSYRQEEIDSLMSRAWNMAYELYGDTSAEPETWTAYLFYGYVYPEENACYWRVHFRDASLANWLTVQVDGSNPGESEMTIVMQSAYHEDVG